MAKTDKVSEDKNSQNNENNEIDEFLMRLKSDIEALCGECRYEKGVMRAMVHNLGVSNSSAILEVVFEGLDNGNDLPYPALYFHFTLAKDIEAENYGKVAALLCELNTAITLGDFKSFGSFGLYQPLGQIYYSYRMPINAGALLAETENVRYFLATTVDNLEIFNDLVLYVSDGREEMTLDKYLEYLKKTEDLNTIEERANAFIAFVDELFSENK